MRLRISEEESFPGQAYLWEANLERSLKGRKGQAALRDLEAALLAMPEKRLIADDLISADGDVCSIAALAKYRGYEGDMKLPTLDDDEFNHINEYNEWQFEQAVEDAMLKVAGDLAVPRLVAVAIIHENDDTWPIPKTPEERYDKMLRWTQRQLNQAHTR